MQTKKMSLANVQGKMSRNEMKEVMAGNAPADSTCNCNSADDCTGTNELCMNSCNGKIGDPKVGKCGCPEN